MPTLKQLTCSVEWESTSVALQEFRTTYSDGYVETYIVVPHNPTPFSIHLQSNGYIAPGLSMFVYMDGVYQCNRLRRNLRMPEDDSPKHHTEIDFRVRQKEQMLSNGKFFGMAWNFNRVNIGLFFEPVTKPLRSANAVFTVSNSNNDVAESPPHNGEFVGTIEVVVLRCCPPRTPSIGSAETLVDQASPSPRETTATRRDKSGEPKPKLKPKNKPESNSKTKTKPKRRPFGLDGAWDEPDPSKPPNGKKKEAQPDRWDNWNAPPLSTEDLGDKASQGQANPSRPTERPNIETVKMMSASEGVYQPVNGGKKAGSEAGSNQGSSKGVSHSVAPNGWHRSSPHAGSQAGSDKGSQRTAPLKASNEGGQQTPNSMHLRGGGSRTQSIKSHDPTGHRSPLVVNNSIVYNGVGTPPPLSAGPPAARNFWANIDAKQKAKTAPAAASKPAPAIDPWGDLPALDTMNGAAADPGPSAKDKVDNWEATGSGMPGSWDTFNESQKHNGSWDTSNDALQNNDNDWPDTNDTAAVQRNDHNGDTSNNVGENSGWDQQPDQPQQNGDSWGNFEGQANNNANSNRWEKNNHDENQQQDTREVHTANVGSKSNGWVTGYADNTQRNNTGRPDTATLPLASGQKTQNRKKNKKNKNSKPASAKGPKPDSTGEPSSGKAPVASSKSRGKGSFLGWLNSSSNEVPEESKDPNTNQKIAASGPRQSNTPRSKKQRSPKAADPVAHEVDEPNEGQVQPSLSLLTTPGAKPYWSTWRDSEETLNATEADDVDEDVEAPLYDIPKDVAERKKLSHQIRPSVPTKYSHKTMRPKYMDSHEHPYAVFVFHYRDREIIQEVLNTSIVEPEEDEKSRLLSLPKDQLVDELIKAKSQDSSNATSGSRKSRGSRASFKSNPWGVASGPDASALTEKLSKLESSKAATPEKVGGWLNTANEARDTDVDRGDTWVETNDHDANGKSGGGDTWADVNDQKDDNDNNEAWDNNNDTTAPGDAWNTNGDTAGGDTWTNDHNDQTPADNNDTNGDMRWDNGGDSWNNNEEQKNGNDTVDDKNAGDWVTSGFDGIDTSWNDSEKKDDHENDNTGGGGNSWDFGNSGGGGGSGW